MKRVEKLLMVGVCVCVCVLSLIFHGRFVSRTSPASELFSSSTTKGKLKAMCSFGFLCQNI